MLTHAQIWTALDRLAARAGMSPSGLAKAAGLDPTTFNKSKRITPDGRARWPSTESVAMALTATKTSIDVFVQLIQETGGSVAQAVPLLAMADAVGKGCFDDAGLPVGKSWDEIPFPAINDENAYALEISGNAMEPTYRDGTIIVVSPSASIRRGDRVVLQTKQGEMMVQEIKRRTSKTIDLRAIDHERADRTLALRDVLWTHRIVWASQ
jgi:phage repressor protein C with HTH and peptisase S24 domain